MNSKILLSILGFLAFRVDPASAWFGGSFFSSLLYEVGACKQKGPFCPKAPCHSHPKLKACTSEYVSACNGDANCMAEMQTNEASSYYDEADQSYERNYIDGGSNGVSGTSVAKKINWMPYMVGGSIVALAAVTIAWRKRHYVGDDDLSDELGRSDPYSVRSHHNRYHAQV